MKQFIITTLVLFFTLQASALTDTSIVEQYCQIIATPRILSNKVTIDIDYGEERSIWRDNRLKTDDGRLKKFNTVIDALNYMGKDGWVLVNAFPVLVANTQTYYYVFKKLFKKFEVAN